MAEAVELTYLVGQMKSTCPRCASLCVKFKFLNQFGENDDQLNHSRFLCLHCHFPEQATVSTGDMGQTSASNLLEESTSPSTSDVREQSIPIPPESTPMRTTPGTEGTFAVRVVNKCPKCSSIHSAGINTWHQINIVYKPRYECEMCKSIFDLGRKFYQTGQAAFSEAVGDRDHEANLAEPIDLVRVIKTCPVCSSTSTQFKSLILYSAKSSHELCLKCSSEKRLQLQLAIEKLF